ncbi:MAG: InlB B-repeat-containing protein [Clostridia bacterium]|nr:InlB B-repeat-containing protein [Clostridia bacterium]
MKTNRKMIRALALVLSVLMLGSIFATVIPFVVGAADESGNIQYPISGYNPSVECPDPIPMLCIVVNFDPNGNGIDDNADGRNVSAVKTEGNALYGEQWCHFNHDVWYDMLYGEEGQTLKNYYKLMSNGQFYFTPAPETYADAAKNGIVNDGIVEVNIKGPHLELKGAWVYYYADAIKQADEYVDFSVFDKDGNGKIDERELIVSFINGGAELAQTPYGTTTNIEVFRSRAYYRSNRDNQMIYEADGYKVGEGGLFITGAWSSMSSRADKATEFAVWAHELGHYLGAPDYYDTEVSATSSNPGYHYTTGYYSLMGKGCHGGQPAHIDPFTMTSELTGYGFYVPQRVTEDGEYTLYSKTSSKGTYNVIKLCTPDPDEYYLIENRYISPSYEGEAFDKYGIDNSQGILIWHVDENNYSSTAANNSKDGNDPTLAVYATNTKNIKRLYGQEVSAAFGGDNSVFNVSDYIFPVSKTWYTSLTAEQAKEVENLKIEVISDFGEEMTIKVTGAYDLKQTPSWSVWDTNVTQTSATVTCTLETLNYSTLNAAKFELIEASTKSVLKTEDILLNQNYQFNIDCTGLKADTNYIVRITSDTSNGEGVYEKDFYTNPAPVEKTKATVTIFANSDKITKTTSKPKVGEYVKISDAMASKKGYKLAGWYLDEALTQPFDITKPIESTDDFSIYAKWVAEANAATLTLVGAEADGVTYAAEAGGKFIAPTPKAKEGYTFGGWYADADCTAEFDFEKAAEAAGEVKIYAKWVSENGDIVTPNSSASTPTTPDNTTSAPITPGANNGAGNTTTIVIIVVAAVVVVAGVAVAAGVVLSKKKK